jgi:HK97 family phage major capsid protein
MKMEPEEVEDGSLETPTKEEKDGAETLEQLTDKLVGIVDQAELRMIAKMNEAIETLATPDRSKVPTPEPKRGKPRDNRIEVTDGSLPLYRKLPEDQRQIRSPDADHWMAEWIRGVAGNDWSRVKKAHDKLREHFRASTLYGTPDTTSGIGDGTGAPLAPLPLANLVVLARDKAAKLRPLCTRFTSAGNTLRVPVSGVATAAMAAEGTTAAQGEPTLSSKLLSKKKMQARFVASEEMLQDSAFSLVSFFSERAGSAFGALEDVQICTSDGTAPNMTESLGSATITEVTETTATELIYQDIVDVFFGVPSQYQARAVWMGNPAMMGFLSSMVDGNSRPLFTPGQAAPGVVTDDVTGAIGTIFARPVMNVPLAAGSLFVGDPAMIGLLDGGGITAKASDTVGWTSDVVNFKVTQRVDCVILLEDAFRCIKGITALG